MKATPYTRTAHGNAIEHFVGEHFHDDDDDVEDGSEPGDPFTDDGQGAGLCHRFHPSNQPPLLALVGIAI